MTHLFSTVSRDHQSHYYGVGGAEGTPMGTLRHKEYPGSTHQTQRQSIHFFAGHIGDAPLAKPNWGWHHWETALNYYGLNLKRVSEHDWITYTDPYLIFKDGRYEGPYGDFVAVTGGAGPEGSARLASQAIHHGYDKSHADLQFVPEKGYWWLHVSQGQLLPSQPAAGGGRLRGKRTGKKRRKSIKRGKKSRGKKSRGTKRARGRRR